MRKWRSASESSWFDPADPPEVRRVSEWPTEVLPEIYRLSRIDPYSITIRRRDYSGPVEVGMPFDAYAEDAPTSRWNVLACGLGAPVITLMMRVGAQLAQRRYPGFEDLLILTEIHPELNLPWNGAFPAGLNPEKLAQVLLDPETLLHAIVSYDVESKGADDDLWSFRDSRDEFRPGCPFVVHKRFPNVQVALGEFRSIIAHRSGIVHHAARLYHEVRNAIATQRDWDPNGYL